MSRKDARTSSLRRRPSRTVPATLVALLLTVAGVAATWAAVVRLSTGRWPSWVVSTNEWAAGQTWGSAVVIAISIVTALLGLVLLVTALAPGRPNAYEIEPPETEDEPVDGREVVMTRRAVAMLATAHATLVDGVSSASAVVTGHAVSLTVRTPSAHRETIEQAVTARVAQVLTAVGLTPVPTVATTARTEKP